jgi:ABC-type branched-subunit amino acid transport system ATPase component/branched-subunit amino acid ABC-type transport system permease component
MPEEVVFLLLGLGNGAVFASLALALVLTFRSSGIVNFATGGIALYTAYTFAFLRKGQLLLPVPGLPKMAHIGENMAVLPAMALSLLIAAAFGMLLYGVVFRPLRTAPAVAKAVASLGVLIVVQAVLAARVGTAAVAVAPVLPHGVVTLGGARIPEDRLWFAAIVVAVTAAFVLLFRFTRFGLATRAAAESERGALLTGLSPDRIAMVNWALSAAVAGLSGILIAPIIPLIPVSYTLFIVPALAAALVGGFTSVGLAVGAGLALGMVQSLVQYWQSTRSWLPSSGVPELVPLILISVYLVLRGKPLPSRGAIVTSTLGRAPRPRRVLLPAALGSAAGVVLLLGTHGSYRAAVISSIVFGVIAMSWVVVTGYAGQVSLAQLTLAGVSAFSLARLGGEAGIPFPLAPLLAALIAAAGGVLVGLPALRVRGLPVAVVTLSLSVALESLWFQNSDFNGGLKGAPVTGPNLAGWDLSIGAGSNYPRMPFALLCLAVLVAVAVGVAQLRTSRLGAAMLAVRANERSAAAAGISVARVKLMAFAIGSFIAGLGGALLAYSQATATPESFSAIGGLGLFAAVYLAGITSLLGGITAGLMAGGGLVFILLDRHLSLGSWYLVLTGIGLLLSVVYNPEGIVGPMHQLIQRRRYRDAPAPALVAGTVPERRPAVFGEELLRLDAVSVRYGGVVANDEVSLTVREGEIVGLIGPNGAGKTTLIDAISGFAASTGTVALAGVPLGKLAPHRRVQQGLGRTFQGLDLYDDLTVSENVAVGRAGGAKRPADGVTDVHRDSALLAMLSLSEVADRPVRELSQGQRQLVSIARALAGRPRMVLLDEPAAGLDSSESAWLAERLRDVREHGITVLLVDHDMSLVLDVCDRVVVLDVGRVIAQGTPDEVQRDPAVAAAYLGSTHAHHETAPSGPMTKAQA